MLRETQTGGHRNVVVFSAVCRFFRISESITESSGVIAEAVSFVWVA